MFRWAKCHHDANMMVWTGSRSGFKIRIGLSAAQRVVRILKLDLKTGCFNKTLGDHDKTRYNVSQTARYLKRSTSHFHLSPFRHHAGTTFPHHHKGGPCSSRASVLSNCDLIILCSSNSNCCYKYICFEDAISKKYRQQSIQQNHPAQQTHYHIPNTISKHVFSNEQRPVSH